MSAESVKRFKEKVAAGTPIVLSVYEDQNGLWAKDREFVERVRVKFADMETTFMTMDEVNELTRAEQDLINHAPSSEAP